jgi:hypothetical protein
MKQMKPLTKLLIVFALTPLSVIAFIGLGSLAYTKLYDRMNSVHKIKVSYPNRPGGVSDLEMLQRLVVQMQKHPDAQIFELWQPSWDKTTLSGGELTLLYNRREHSLQSTFFANIPITEFYKSVADEAIFAAAKVDDKQVKSTLKQYGASYELYGP